MKMCFKMENEISCTSCFNIFEGFARIEFLYGPQWPSNQEETEIDAES
jgi:hypothetical protein